MKFSKICKDLKKSPNPALKECFSTNTTLQQTSPTTTRRRRRENEGRPSGRRKEQQNRWKSDFSAKQRCKFAKSKWVNKTIIQ